MIRTRFGEISPGGYFEAPLWHCPTPVEEICLGQTGCWFPPHPCRGISVLSKMVAYPRRNAAPPVGPHIVDFQRLIDMVRSDDRFYVVFIDIV